MPDEIGVQFAVKQFQVIVLDIAKNGHVLIRIQGANHFYDLGRGRLQDVKRLPRNDFDLLHQRILLGEFFYCTYLI
jgi:hypothetical protein